MNISEKNSDDDNGISQKSIKWTLTEEKLDMALLTRRDPIELFDEVSLRI